MTSEKLAELAELNAAIADAPENVPLLYKRAQFFGEQAGHFASALADCRHALEIIWDRNKGAHDAHRVDIPLNFHYYCGRAFQNNPETPAAQFRRAQAIAAFEWMRRHSPDLKGWSATLLEPDPAEILQRAAGLDIPKLYAKNASSDMRSDEFKFWALAVGITQSEGAATLVYALALRAEIAAGVWSNDASACERRSRSSRWARYQRAAWRQLAVECAPDDPLWLLRRGWCNRGSNYRAGTNDLTRAIALAPDDPRGYEIRARLTLSLGDCWWNNAPDSQMPAADHLRALRLRIARGQIAGDAARLAAQGDQLISRFPEEDERARARAHAFYSLAIECEPDNASHYMARARTIDTLSEVQAEIGESVSPKAARGAHPDYVRALTLDPALAIARTKIVRYWIQELRHDSAHEQIEALLNARQSLTNAGLTAATSDAIIAEVERALAT